MTTSRLTNSISPATAGRLLLNPFVLICLALSPMARAVLPAPDGGYPADNTAEGTDALFSLTIGIANTANGVSALYNNTTGNGNIALGFEAGFGLTTGDNNTVIGFQALIANTTGGNNIAVGYLAGNNLSTGNNNIDIGNLGVAAEANTIRIGRVFGGFSGDPHTATFIAGISGVTVPSADPGGIDANGHLGTVRLVSLIGATRPTGPT